MEDARHPGLCSRKIQGKIDPYLSEVTRTFADAEARMGLVSLQSDINERRSENEAAIILDDQYPLRRRQNLGRFDPQLVAAAKSIDMLPEELWDLRKWIRDVTKECNERLSREMVIVYGLSENTDHVVEKHYLSKIDASQRFPILAGDLLDLDTLYEGLLVRARYIYVSESAFDHGISAYGPVEILNGLIAERTASP